MKLLRPFFCLALPILLGAACAGTAGKNSKLMHNSPESIIKELFASYQHRNEKGFAKLVMPFKLVDKMVSAQALPAGADVAVRPKVSQKEYLQKALLAFGRAVDSTEIDWKSAQLESNLPTKEAVPMKSGYTVVFYQMVVATNTQKWVQNLTLIKIEPDQFWLGDVVPFEKAGD